MMVTEQNLVRGSQTHVIITVIIIEGKAIKGGLGLLKKSIIAIYHTNNITKPHSRPIRMRRIGDMGLLTVMMKK